jgi:sodium-coupled neutral amino acid transporter 9
MFDYAYVPAFVLRLAIFFLLFTTYPLISHFLKNLIKNLIWHNEQLSANLELTLTILLSIIPLLCALFYPNVGTLLSYVGALSGFVIIYCLPVMVYLKQKRLEITNPLLAEAIAQNEFKV